jgi:transcriptional regulator with XRE-family HTH domain
MAQVATATGLTSGFLSQLERDLTSVSLSSLARICAALDVRFGDVLDKAPAGEVIRRHEARSWTEVGVHEDILLSPRDERRFHLIESHIPPAADAGEDLYTFPADVELVYVLAGTLELRVGGRTLGLRAGDTFTYSPREPHSWRNPSAEDEVVVLWFSVPNPHSSGREGEPP